MEKTVVSKRKIRLEIYETLNIPYKKDHNYVNSLKIMVCLGARGMGFPRELFFGSTSNFILHKAKAPVTVVK